MTLLILIPMLALLIGAQIRENAISKRSDNEIKRIEYNSTVTPKIIDKLRANGKDPNEFIRWLDSINHGNILKQKQEA